MGIDRREHDRFAAKKKKAKDYKPTPTPKKHNQPDSPPPCLCYSRQRPLYKTHQNKKKKGGKTGKRKRGGGGRAGGARDATEQRSNGAKEKQKQKTKRNNGTNKLPQPLIEAYRRHCRRSRRTSPTPQNRAPAQISALRARGHHRRDDGCRRRRGERWEGRRGREGRRSCH